MERVIRFLQGAAMIALLAAVVAGYGAVRVAAASIQSCDDDPFCHDMAGSDLVAVAASCGAPTCNSRGQICCLPEFLVP